MKKSNSKRDRILKGDLVLGIKAIRCHGIKNGVHIVAPVTGINPVGPRFGFATFKACRVSRPSELK